MVKATNIQIIIFNLCGTPQARAPERGTGPKERLAGPRGMDPLGPVPEYLILHHSRARGVSQWLFYASYHIIRP